MSSVTISPAVTTSKTTDGVSKMAIKQQPNKIQRSNLRQTLSFNAYYDAMQKRKLESTCIMSSVTISPAVTTSKTTDGVSYKAIKQQPNKIQRSNLRQTLCFTSYYHAMQKRKLESTCIMSSVTISLDATTIDARVRSS
jgi:sulfur relay (sulfurtransferase) DsrF/TusC family protein